MPAEGVRERQSSWLEAGERYFAARLAALGDDTLCEPSALPGWSRAHVVGHVARNADALGNLVDWARTGVERPMYPEPGARERDIERSAAAPPEELRADLAQASTRLADAWAALPAQAWDVRVRSALGRDIPVGETVWMRVRELWVHAVDLDSDGRLEDLPMDLVAALLDDATDTLTRRGGPDVLLSPTDMPSTWRIGDDRAPNRSVSAPARGLLGWVLGRTAAPPPGPLPSLPRWL